MNDSRPLRPTVAGSLVYALSSLPVGTVTFAVVISFLALSIGLLPLAFLGFASFLFTFWLSRRLGDFERARASRLLRLDLPSPHIPPPPGSSLTAQFLWWGKAKSTWREVAHHLLTFPLCALTFCLTVAFWSTAMACLAYPTFAWALPEDGQGLNLGVIHLGLVVSSLILVPLGLVALLVGRTVTRGLVGLHAVAARLLTADRSEELARRVDTLERSRSSLVDAVDAERRRIERDLHDGAQQRLVSVAMNLGMAKAKAAKDPTVPEEIRALITSAHTESKTAIGELRDVARGVHPAILEDRGLDAALSSLAGRSPIMVRLHTIIPPELPRPIEAAAYFVVSEALTNVNKHSGATAVDVTILHHGYELSVEVRDDGRGGATVGARSAEGSGGLSGGLAGLADRVHALDGELVVDSPVGGPTIVKVTLPCVL